MEPELMTLEPQHELSPELELITPELTTLESEDPKLDTLCADLERIATEMEVTEIIEVRQPEMTREILRAAEPREVTSCCRMLGEVNGRSNFKEQALVSWGDDGFLQLS